MAPVERHPEPTSEVRPGSVGSRTSTARSASLRTWADGPWAKVFVKAAGIGLLMLGLGGIGALAMAQGLTTHSAPVSDGSARRTTAPAEPAGWAAHASASLAGAVALAGPAAPAPSTSASDSPSAPKAPSGITDDGRVILNLASADELRKLPGVGQKRAEAIVALRQKLGKFKRATDLLRIRGIGPKRLKQMLPKLLLDPPKETPATPVPAPAASAK
ncbi:MAG TPA: helix-hairpin-helix domain-containing protein [Polyangiaceae bacterium]|nr:helix-hairpin-helix domain-containing protein [Polyangiaceae bacterium]